MALSAPVAEFAKIQPPPPMGKLNFRKFSYFPFVG